MAFWACCRTESQREHVAQLHLERAGFECYLPLVRTERRVARANGHTPPISTTTPLFPRYLFAFVANDRWWPIRSTIGISGIIMSDGHPAYLDERIIAQLKARQSPDGLIELPKARALSPGERIRVTGGIFRGQLGIYAGMSGRERCEVLLACLAARVQLDRRHVVRA